MSRDKYWFYHIKKLAKEKSMSIGESPKILLDLPGRDGLLVNAVRQTQGQETIKNIPRVT
jgi:hypothetical protein